MTDAPGERGLRRLAHHGPVEGPEDAARRVGLSLERLEIIRRSPELAAAVVEAVRAGADHGDLEELDWEAAAREAFSRDRPGEGASPAGRSSATSP